MRLSYNGIDPVNALAEDTQEADLKELTAFLEDDYNGNRIVIDCTASQEVANCYPKWLAEGIHVVATNKKAGSGPGELYDRAKQASLASKTQWLYETTAPGSGLPLLATLKDMTQSGDVVKTVSGRFSGSASFIFSQLREGVPLSKALAAACAKPGPKPDSPFNFLACVAQAKLTESPTPVTTSTASTTRARLWCSAAISGSSSS